LGALVSHHVASDTMVQLICNNGAKWITVGMIISALGRSILVFWLILGFLLQWLVTVISLRLQSESNRSIALQAVLSSFKRALRFCSC
jgi:hypothetical protein